MESYLYPPKYLSSAAIATLAPPTMYDVAETEALQPLQSSDDLRAAS